MKALPLRFLCCVLIVLPAFALPQPGHTIKVSPPRGAGVQFDIPAIIGRSDIILGRANLDPNEAVPLGNGRLGVAVWSSEGFSAQLNRNDTLPERLSSGQVVIPGLVALTRAKDYSGRLNLYRGEFREQGGGMTAVAFVEPLTDTLVVDISGANPNESQTALLRLWAPRSPHAAASGPTGFFAESWIDNKNPGASGRAFGSLAAITASARDVSAAVTDPLTITLSFKPYEDGHFRVIVAAPHYDGTQNSGDIAAHALTTESDRAHLSWWQDFWSRAAIIKITSLDGAGEYMENLRNIYLFVAAIEAGFEYPGSQAGVADMISAARDEHRWDSSAFWHWNLRMQTAANIGAGLPELNASYFNLYRANLPAIENWTREHMNGHPGICVPETMRFNGPGIEYESTWKPISIGRDCDADFKPYYNARTITTGAEVSLWVWRQYLSTGDRKFLADNYPLIAASVRFLLSYQQPGPDGLLHTSPSNAHETQWDVRDPTTDIAAISALYPAAIQAATLLGKDADLVRRMQAALPKIPPLPRTQAHSPRTLLPSSSGDHGADVIAESYQPEAEDHNIENIGLEPVWPYGIIGDTSPLFSVALRTYQNRPNSSAVDWSFDPIQAARLHLGSEVASTLIATTRKFQGFINGMAKWEASAREFYVEQTGIVADALQEALAQDYDGLIRIAPAIPPGWDFDGSIYVRGKTRVDVQTRNGEVMAVAIVSGSNQSLKIRSPWPDKQVDVLSLPERKKILSRDSSQVLEFTATAGVTYALENRESARSHPSLPVVSGTPAVTAKKLGPVQIGLFPPGQ